MDLWVEDSLIQPLWNRSISMPWFGTLGTGSRREPYPLSVYVVYVDVYAFCLRSGCSFLMPLLWVSQAHSPRWLYHHPVYTVLVSKA